MRLHQGVGQSLARAGGCISKVALHGCQVSAGSWQNSVSRHVEASTRLLENPCDVAADFPPEQLIQETARQKMQCLL